jgi:hypothetical protein
MELTIYSGHIPKILERDFNVEGNWQEMIVDLLVLDQVMQN